MTTTFHRKFLLDVEARAAPGESRQVEASLSSELPVYRADLGANEILEHTAAAIDFSRSPYPLLTQHDSSELPVGAVENVRLVGRTLRGTLRMGESSRAAEIWNDIKSGVLRSISVAYQVLDGFADGENYRVTRWQPLEFSLVSVPADYAVGIGRSHTPQSKGSTVMSQVDLSSTAPQDYSLFKAVNAMITGDWQHAGFEREQAREMELQQPGRNARGFLVPSSVIGKRVMMSTGAGTGAELVPTQHIGFVDMLRNESVVIRAGATTMPGLVGNVDIPRQSAAATGEWLPEDGPITTSDLSFESVTLIPKSVGAMLSWSRRMFLNANPDIESVCRADLAAVIGLAVDKGALHGIGTSNQPDGLYHHAGVSVLAFGGLPTYAKLLAMVEDLAISNALRGQLAFVTTPQIAGLLSRTLVASAAGSEMVWTGSLLEGRICGFPAFATNQVSSTLEAGAEHGLIFGNFADLLIGQWGSSVDILVDPYTDADRGRVRITAFADLDVALRHPESFCKATGLTIV